jgi:transposase
LDHCLSGLRTEEQMHKRQSRRISRREHEAVLEAVQVRFDRNPDKMRLRHSVKHPFGTIKSWMGSMHFQMKTLKQ